MPNKNRVFAGALIALVMLTGSAAAFSSVDLSNPAFAPITGPKSIPIGAAEFCKTHREDCGPSAGAVDVEPLTEAGWRQLVAINDAINTSVVPVTDSDLYRVTEFWTYPAGSGDCDGEDEGESGLGHRSVLFGAVDGVWGPARIRASSVPFGPCGGAVVFYRCSRVMRTTANDPFGEVPRTRAHSG